MKQIFLIIVSFLLIVSIVKVPVFAQETVVETDTPIGIDVQATPSSAVVQRVNYELPYPGILPDNPFYFLKVFRDGVVKMLINDDMTRARFNLINAEKRMYAGKMLVEKGKDKLALETISKGNNYLGETLSTIQSVKRQNPKNPDVKPFLQQFKTASLKNQEIARDIKPLISKEFISAFTAEERRIKSISKSINELLIQR